MVVKCKIKKGDKVIVIAGKDKGKNGEVLKVFPTENKILVSGINTVKKHQKATQNAASSIVTKDLPLHISNVAFLDPKENKATKIGYKIEKGNKVRYTKLSNTILDN